MNSAGILGKIGNLLFVGIVIFGGGSDLCIFNPHFCCSKFKMLRHEIGCLNSVMPRIDNILTFIKNIFTFFLFFHNFFLFTFVVLVIVIFAKFLSGVIIVFGVFDQSLIWNSPRTKIALWLLTKCKQKCTCRLKICIQFYGFPSGLEVLILVELLKLTERRNLMGFGNLDLFFKNVWPVRIEVNWW